MLLISLKLENIRSYISEKIEFPAGSVLLSGDIGSGKSTMLLAIEFALFGILRSELSGTSLLRHGTTKGSVELSFKIEDKIHTVKRTLKKSKDTVTQDAGYLVSEGKKFEGTPVELKAKILHLLGYPESMLAGSKSLIYRFTVYTAQEQMKQILFEDKETRLNTLRKVFGIDKYKTIKDNSTILIRQLKSKKAEILARLERFDLVKKQLEEKLMSKESLEKEIGNKTSELVEKKKELASTKRELSVAEEIVKQFLGLKKTIEIKELDLLAKNHEAKELKESIDYNAIEALKVKLSGFPDRLEIIDEKPIEDQLSKLTRYYDESLKRRARSEESKKNFIRRNEELLSQIKELSAKTSDIIRLQARLDAYNEKLSMKKDQEKLFEEMLKKDKEINVKIASINSKISQAMKLSEFMDKNENCPTCQQGIDSNHKRHVKETQLSTINALENDKHKELENLKKVESNQSRLRKNLDILLEIESRYQKEKETLVRMQEWLSELEARQKEFSKLNEQKAGLEDDAVHELDDLTKEMKILKEKLSMARENNMQVREKTNLQKLIDSEAKSIAIKESVLRKLEREITALASELEQLKQNLGEFLEINNGYLKLKLYFEEMQAKEKELEIRLASLKQENKTIDEVIKQLKDELDELKRSKEKLEQVSKMLNWVDEFFVKLMTTMEKHVMVTVHREFTSLLKKWFSILIEDVEINLDDEFSVSISQDGYETDIADLSGGEKTSVALAYRLALNKVVNDLVPMINTKDLIILDEPTDGFSTEQLDKVRDILRELNMKQTIIVSHESKMESYVDSVIRIEKRDGVSRIT